MNKKNWKKILTILSGIALLTAFVLSFFDISTFLIKGLYLLAIFSGGYYVIIAAAKGLIKQRFFNINFLVIIAAIGAAYIDQLAEAGAVIFFFSLAEIFEDYGIDRSRRAVEALIKKSPQVAVLKDGKKISIEQVKIDDVVVVKPGELIPVDGKIIRGSSSINEANITGESMPRDRHIGDSVFASTLNQNGYLEIKTTKEIKDSTFSKIIELVRSTQASKAPTQIFIDRFAKYYTPFVVVGAILIASIPPLFIGGNFMDWLYRALVMLVISCPCALVISTPVSIVSALGGASRRGVLIKGGKYLELLGKIKAVALDKTGTLTTGKPEVVDIVTFNGFSEKEVLADASGLEQFSSHPLAESIIKFSNQRGIKPHTMEKYENIVGKGGKADCLVCDDIEHCIGNLELIQSNGLSTEEVRNKTEKLEKEGKTVVLISKGKKVMGALAIADSIREEAYQTIKKLKRDNIEPVILTGDNQYTADFVGRKLGIKKVYASLLPSEKEQRIRDLKSEFKYTAMIGDGVNDAPSLAGSTVGIAMGVSGSDVAVETADIALMNNNLENIPYVLKLGRKTLATIKINITAAIGVKALFLILALFGQTNLVYAIGADSGVAILVILNSLRLYKFNT